MIFDLFCPVYNEEYMLPFMVEHYRRCLNGHTINFNIYDNGSMDKTIEIVKELGCNVGYFYTDSKVNDLLLMNFKNNVWKDSKADYVIIIDCDEFIEIVPNKLINCTIVKSEGYDMLGYGIYTPLDIKNGIRHTPEDKTCVFSPKDITDINYEVGAHTCNPIGNIIYLNEPFKLFHMKAHSLVYMQNKFKESQDRLSQINKDRKWGIQYSMTSQEIEEFHNNRYNQRQIVR